MDDENSPADPPDSAQSRKSKNLKDATSHLKEEAIRRYKQKINDQDDNGINDDDNNEAVKDDTQQPPSEVNDDVCDDHTKESDQIKNEQPLVSDTTTDPLQPVTGTETQSTVALQPSSVEPHPPSQPKPSGTGSRPSTPKMTVNSTDLTSDTDSSNAKPVESNSLISESNSKISIAGPSISETLSKTLSLDIQTEQVTDTGSEPMEQMDDNNSNVGLKGDNQDQPVVEQNETADPSQNVNNNQADSADTNDDVDENQPPPPDNANQVTDQPDAQENVSEDQQPLSTEDTDQQPASADNTDQQPPSTETADQQPPSTENADQQPPSTENADQQPPSTERTDQQPTSTDNADLADLPPADNGDKSADQPPSDNASVDQLPVDSADITGANNMDSQVDNVDNADSKVDSADSNVEQPAVVQDQVQMDQQPAADGQTDEPADVPASQTTQDQSGPPQPNTVEPSDASVTNDKVNAAQSDSVAPSDTTVATDQPSDTNAATDQPSDTTAATDQPSDTTVATDQPSDTTAATDQPSDTTAATDQPSDTTAATDQPSDTTAATDQPSDTTAATDQPSDTTAATDQPSDATAATDQPSDTTATTDKPSADQQVDAQDGPVDGQDPNIRGDEYEIMSDEVRQGDNEPLIPDNFYYDFEDHVSRPKITDDSGLPLDMLKLKHSFGYDCHKRANLHLLDSRTVLFVAGNVAEILSLQTGEQTHIRSTSDGGVGAVAVHPSRKYFAVAEKGQAPNINIFEWPSLKLHRILRGGTQESYAYCEFSPDGKLLASVGGDPDYMLTLWNWKQEQTVLRSKAFSQDVFKVSFSTELEGQLTSSGTGHIRFWKMADTFTGLKLQGQLGKFGKTEITDIEGYVELPDGKVLSGSEWGNMLLWDGGLIKVEICRKNKKPCHVGPISQIVMDEGELMTVGEDGCIRVWDFETIDTADTTDEDAIFEMEPMNELKVGHGHEVRLRGITKSVDAEEPTIWFAQDMNGGVWKLDLSFSHTSQVPEKVMAYHAGAVTGCATSPVSDIVATCGADASVRVYDYMSQQQLCTYRFNVGGTCILWAPQVVDPKGGTIICGFEDGVVRVLVVAKKETNKKSKDESELLLAQVFKPHTKKVTAMAFDNKGEILATGGEDNTIFFMNVNGETLEPIGFINIPGPVSHLTWSPGEFKETTLLVSCSNGLVLEIEAPEPDKYDTQHSYLITGIKMKTHQFKSVKSRLRHEEELERKHLEEEARLKKKEEERRKLIDRGIEPPEEEEEEEEKKEEEAWKPFIPSDPSPINLAFYSKEPGKFWLSMSEFDAGYLYECKFLEEDEKPNVPADQLYEPVRTIPVIDSSDVPIAQVHFDQSHGGHQVIMGMEDGGIRIQPLSDPTDLSTLGPYWMLHMHDNHYGRINNIATSYDGNFMFTCANDGNFFSYYFMTQQEIEEKTKENKAKIPSSRKELKDENFKVDDIDDPSAYSIEDAKQKSEYDKMMQLAEEKKQGVRRTIAQLRRQFKKIVVKNEELPKHLQILKQEFEMDPEIKKELEKQTQEKIELVKKEMAWEAEKHRIALEKLKERFKACVECEYIIVKAFCTPHEVASFRASKLSDGFYDAKAESERRKLTNLSKESTALNRTGTLLPGSQSADGADAADASQVQGQNQIKTSLKGAMGERISKALEKVEEKKKKRAIRRAEWNQLHTSKPADEYEDPEDVAAIKDAQDHMGDFKLKTADDYVVPDHLRMNVEKARGRLLVLKDLMHEHKFTFNQSLLALRGKKITIIEEIRNCVAELKKVQAKLGPEKSLPIPPVPELHPDEIPEKKMEYTRESLLKFKEENEKRLIAEKLGKDGTDGGGGGGFGGFGGGGGGGGAAAANTASDVKHAPSLAKRPSIPFREQKPSLVTMRRPSQFLRQTKHGSANKRDHALEAEVYAELLEDESSLTPLEIKMKQAEEIRMIYLRDSLLKKIDNLLKTFDAELRVLNNKKTKFAIDLKNADLRHVTLFEELMLLKEYEKHENVLAEKLESKQREKLEMQQKIVEVNQKLEGKKKDIEKLQENEKALHAKFLASLGENNKFADYLTKVFKKKIKRSKKKATEGADSDEDSDESSDDDSDWDEDEESDEEGGGYDLDICPPGCDQSLYDNTCQLREKRLDIEEALTEEKKNRDQFNKDGENLQKKGKVIQAALKTAEADLEAFQLEKQQKLNELDVVVTLKLHQIQHIINGILPQDLSQTLVFESPELIRLQYRIKELEHEKAMQKKQQKEAKKKHVQLIKDRRLFLTKIDEMNDKCDEAMIAKFGRIVDLEQLEQVTVNRNIEELKEKLRINEILCSEEISEWEKKIQKTKDDITALTRQNTERLDLLNMLTNERKDLQESLDSRQKHLGGEYSGVRKADLHERQRLIQLVQLQAQEVEALKEEIMLLSRKGGHILPPAQPPLPPQHRPISSGP